MSARFVCSFKSLVIRWQTVTVAIFSSSIIAIGLPTMWLAPTTTLSAPSTATAAWSINSIAAVAVHGAMTARR